VQIDTINVIERCHHHILYTRIPRYRREDLHRAQSLDKTVFEYWTHALSYVPTRDMPFFLGAMRNHSLRPHSWYAGVKTGVGFQRKVVCNVTEDAMNLDVVDMDNGITNVLLSGRMDVQGLSLSTRNSAPSRMRRKKS
jgi:hypothetical protein